MFFVARTRDPADFGACIIRQPQFGCNNGELGCVGGIPDKDHVPNASVPETRKRITAFGCDHYKPFGLFSARSQVVELASVYHYHAIDPHIGLIDQVDPVCAITQQGIAQRLCVFRIPNCKLNGLHINSRRYA